jgi:GT2 family glycosyltransferase
VSPSVSLIVITYGKQQLARNLVDSLRAHRDRTAIREVVIVDNGYPDQGDSRQLLSPGDYPFPVRFVQNPGRSYSTGINLGAAASDGPVLIVSNSDVEWLPDFSIAPLLDHLAAHAEVGVAGPQLVFPDGRWQRSAGPFPSIREILGSLLMLEVLRNGLAAAWLARGQARATIRTVDYIDGAFMVISRRCFDQLGGFDAGFEFYAEDVDFSWRAKQAGWERVQVTAARVMHVRGASSSLLAGQTYARRLLAAKTRFVLKAGGSMRAAWYNRLQRVVAWEYAIVYSMIAALWRTPAWRRRAEAARTVASVVLRGI